MKLTLSIILLFSFAFTVFSQTDKKETQDFLNHPNRFFWSDKNKNCDSIYVEGEQYLIIKAKNITVAISTKPEFMNGYRVVKTFVRNDSGGRIDVRPEDASLETWKKQDDWSKMPPTILKPIPAETIAQKMINRQAWANALMVFGAAMQTQTATITNNQTGASATITSPNIQAQSNAQRQAKAGNTRAASVGGEMVDLSFKANTLFPGNDTLGNIYFKKINHDEGAFILKINDFEYAFFYRKPSK